MELTDDLEIPPSEDPGAELVGLHSWVTYVEVCGGLRLILNVSLFCFCCDERDVLPELKDLQQTVSALSFF